MTRLDSFLVYVEGHRAIVFAAAGILIPLTAYLDLITPDASWVSSTWRRFFCPRRC